MSLTHAQLSAYARAAYSAEEALLSKLEEIAWSIYELAYDEASVRQLEHDQRTTLRQLKAERARFEHLNCPDCCMTHEPEENCVRHAIDGAIG